MSADDSADIVRTFHERLAAVEGIGNRPRHDWSGAILFLSTFASLALFGFALVIL